MPNRRVSSGQTVLAMFSILSLVVLTAACGGTVSRQPAVVSPTGTLDMSQVAFPTGAVGTPLTPFLLYPGGGTPPYVWAVSGGALPDGISLSPEGWISGTPTTAGSFHFVLTVSDANLANGTASSTMNVVGVLNAKLKQTETIYVEQGHPAGQFGSASGGLEPYAYAVSSGSLPPGTTLNGLSLSGSPTVAGTYTFTVTVTDSAGQAAKVSPTYSVWEPIHFAPRTGTYDLFHQGFDPQPAGDTGLPFVPEMTQLPYYGGTPGVTPTLSWRTLDPSTLQQVPPPETTMSGDDGELTVQVSSGAVHVYYGDVDDSIHFFKDPWYGVVAVTLTDPATHESTNEAYILLRVISHYPASAYPTFSASILPGSGYSTEGGTPFTIYGWGLQSEFGSPGTTSIKFGGVPATSFTVVYDNMVPERITGIAPPHAAGDVTVELTSNGVTVDQWAVVTYVAPASTIHSSGTR